MFLVCVSVCLCVCVCVCVVCVCVCARARVSVYYCSNGVSNHSNVYVKGIAGERLISQSRE